jgi:tripartite-type tricarboxylate transporter receptor subunit TctC
MCPWQVLQMAALALASTAVQAQNFPEKSVNVVAPFPPAAR